MPDKNLELPSDSEARVLCTHECHIWATTYYPAAPSSDAPKFRGNHRSALYKVYISKSGHSYQEAQRTRGHLSSEEASGWESGKNACGALLQVSPQPHRSLTKPQRSGYMPHNEETPEIFSKLWEHKVDSL